MELIDALRVLRHTAPPQAPASGIVQTLVNESWETFLQFLGEHEAEILEIAERAGSSEKGE